MEAWRKEIYLLHWVASKQNKLSSCKEKSTRDWTDIISGNFDPTPNKYKNQFFVQLSQITAIGYLKRFFEEQRVSNINISKAEKFSEWLTEQKLSPEQCKREISHREHHGALSSQNL